MPGKIQTHDTSGSESEDDPFKTPRSGRSALREKNSSQADLSTIASTLRETNELIAKMSQRMDHVDGKITEIEVKLKGQASSSPATTPSHSRKKAVPTEVRVSNTYVFFMSMHVLFIKPLVFLICIARNQTYIQYAG